MPRISGPELRPDWGGTGSFGRVAGVADSIACQRAGGSFGDAERLVIDGGICVCHAATLLPFGARCVLGQPRATGVFFGAAWSVWSVAFGDAGAVGWLDWLGD
ncbi:hypothetical protein [Thalassospira sp. MCCC 1A03138]|uniref:hypothetical protein n=1 Tax=Thalassospira sp. MCCC 1A03138 TaxID=1470576 RepID=UPI000A1FF5E2|nr:hypothetical protein [Thalassospira sp. MCCC 1A03138]OSQ32623.1 hypothetical protein TH468_03425 [Thalassospira sp. MCCC 1A03138]